MNLDLVKMLASSAHGMLDGSVLGPLEGYTASSAGAFGMALMILGERDMLTPVRSAMKVAEALPHAEKAILEGSGHALLAERPDPVLDQLIRVV